MTYKSIGKTFQWSLQNIILISDNVVDISICLNHSSWYSRTSNLVDVCKRCIHSRMIRDIRFPIFSLFWFSLVFLWYSLFFNTNIDTRNNKYKYKYRHRRIDFNHTSSHFMYAYDTNIHVEVWHKWEVWLELWSHVKIHWHCKKTLIYRGI